MAKSCARHVLAFVLWNIIHALVVVREEETQFLAVDHVVQYIVRDVQRSGEKEEMTS